MTQGRPITPEGAARLRAELRQLLHVERPKLTREVADAAAQGDRSENAEYIYGKRRLREIDRRLRFLTRRLEELQVVQPGAVADRDRVYFGAVVTLEDEAGALHRYRLVGPDETDAARRAISVSSPLGRALLGKRVGDDIVFERPAGMAELRIVEISYQSGALP